MRSEAKLGRVLDVGGVRGPRRWLLFNNTGDRRFYEAWVLVEIWNRNLILWLYLLAFVLLDQRWK
jgi:hypothetical protein